MQELYHQPLGTRESDPVALREHAEKGEFARDLGYYRGLNSYQY